MKHLLLLIAIIIATPSLCFGQTTKTSKPKQSNTSTANSKTEQEIRGILYERRTMILNSPTPFQGIVSWEEKYFDKNSIITDTINRVFTGEEKISDDKKLGESTSSGVKFKSLGIQREKINVFGDIAVASYQWLATLEFNNEQTADTTLFTSVFAKRNGKWQLIAEHVSNVPTNLQNPSATGN